ncbi:hypothetical protein ACU610_06695 [Geodermatophilus sp. URMC 61]|uniref:hypothetical protein n=1 Tax=Geodermatophilus sp. URMC 61 TaxID=3423411 RepID=UPI00406C3342
MSDRDPGVPNEFDLDPEMALEADGSAEPPPTPPAVENPENPDYVEPAPHAVPVPEDAGQ